MLPPLLSHSPTGANELVVLVRDGARIPACGAWAGKGGWVGSGSHAIAVAALVGGMSLLCVPGAMPPAPHPDQRRARCTCGCRSRRGLSTGRQALSSVWRGPDAIQRRFALLCRRLHRPGAAQPRAPAPVPSGAPWLLLLPPLNLQAGVEGGGSRDHQQHREAVAAGATCVAVRTSAISCGRGCSGLAKHVNAVEGGLPPPSPPLVPPPPQPPAAQVRRPQGGPRRAGGSLASSPHRLRLARAPVRPRDKQPTLRVWQGVVRVPAASRRIYAHTRAAGGRRWHPREWRSCACAVPRCACRCSATRVPCPPSAGTM